MSRVSRAIQISAIGWLALLAWPIHDLAQANPSPAELLGTLGLVALFGMVYTWLWLVNAASRTVTRALAAIVILVGLAVGLNVVSPIGWRWSLLFGFAVIAAGFVLPSKVGISLVGLTTAVVLTTAYLVPPPDTDLYPVSGFILAGVLQLLLLGLGAAGVGQLIKTNAELSAARAEIAGMAVRSERQRLARDLHDLLGHSLSIVALKAELAGRLLRQDPDKAAAEMRDVEQAARQALREMRQAVAGYRPTTLASELASVRAAMDAAAIVLRVEDAAGALPPGVEEVLAWTVREGGTNLLRHSQARHCTISLRRRDGKVCIEIVDDGRGMPDVPSSSGSGLRGLCERVSQRGGELRAESLPGHGFRLAVDVPIECAS